MTASSIHWTVELTSSTSDYAIGTWGDVLIMVWRGQANTESATAFARELARFASTREEGIGLISIILKSASIPKADARKVMANVLGETRIAVSTAVMEGSGFRASAVRGFVQGLSMLARNDYPHKVFGTIDESGKWFANTAIERAPAWDLSPTAAIAVMNSFLKKIATA